MCDAQDALDLEVKQFPEYGLRLILTFRPSTNFLVPLDRCIHLARQAFDTDSGPPRVWGAASAVRQLLDLLSHMLRLRPSTDLPILLYRCMHLARQAFDTDSAPICLVYCNKYNHY